MASDEQVRMELEALFAKIDVREQLRRYVEEQVEAYKYEGMFVPIRFREILPPKEQGDRADESV